MSNKNKHFINTVCNLTEEASLLKNAQDNHLNNDTETLRKLEAELIEKDNLTDTENTVLKLSDYLSAVNMVIDKTFDHHVWVKAEVRNLSSKGGHYYFELAEKEDNKIIASCRATLWKFQASRVLNKFARNTGMQLTRDLTVLIKVTANFHPQYGFSLNIADIDPTYTLGDLAKQYSLIIERLTNEGLINANKQLSAPFDIKNVLVITPEKAAGLGDFKQEADKLAQHQACNFHYRYSLFQGNTAAQNIRQVLLDELAQHNKNNSEPFDLVVIIRGGGAVGDLAYLNDYELAAVVAESSIPVWVGIGHERDKVILDEVAHSSFGTPSKVITAIINHLRSVVNQTNHYMQAIYQMSHEQLSDADKQSDSHIHLIQTHSKQNALLANNRITKFIDSIQSNTQQLINTAKHNSIQNIHSIKYNADKALTYAATHSTDILQTIKLQSNNQLKNISLEVKHLNDITLLYHPNSLLSQGYAIVQQQHNQQQLESISRVADINTNKPITLLMQDGYATAKIIDIHNRYVDT